jgi:hypothetical protein
VARKSLPGGDRTLCLALGLPTLRLCSRSLQTASTQNTISSRINIQYPFHPFCGLDLEVVSKSRHADGSTKAKTPTGFNRLIPGWMLEAEARCYEISDEAHISCKAIVSLIDLLECSIEDLRFGTDASCQLNGTEEQMGGSE